MFANGPMQASAHSSNFFDTVDGTRFAFSPLGKIEELPLSSQRQAVLVRTAFRWVRVPTVTNGKEEA